MQHMNTNLHLSRHGLGVYNIQQPKKKEKSLVLQVFTPLYLFAEQTAVNIKVEVSKASDCLKLHRWTWVFKNKILTNNNENKTIFTRQRWRNSTNKTETNKAVKTLVWLTKCYPIIANVNI